jgi:hypothetical protein
MSSMLSPTQSDAAPGLHAEPSDSTTLHPADLRNDLFPNKRSPITTRAFARPLITFCIGVDAALAWQSQGDAAREMIAVRLRGLAGSRRRPHPTRSRPPRLLPISSSLKRYRSISLRYGRASASSRLCGKALPISRPGRSR